MNQDGDKLRSQLLWAASLLTLPVGAMQARGLSRTARRLPDPEGPTEGTFTGTKATLRVTGLGDSCALGVGAQRSDQSVAARMAAALHEELGCTTHWQLSARYGATLARTKQRLLPQARAFDADVIAVIAGVNDALRMISFRDYRRQLRELLEQIRSFTNAPVVFSQFPPIAELDALPRPLRHTVALHCRVLDHELREELPRHQAAYYAPVRFPIDSVHVSSDKFHASSAGYDCWAQQMLAAVRTTPEFNARLGASVAASALHAEQTSCAE